MLKVVIADDEPDANNFLESSLTVCCPNVKVIAKCFSIAEIEHVINNLSFDVLFLDILMPGGDVFEMLERINKRNFDIVFITAYSQYAIKAIKQSAVDYLLKPVDLAELKNAIVKIEMKRANKEGSDISINNLLKLISFQSKKLEIAASDRITYIRIADIIRFEGDGNYVKIITSKNENFLVTKKLKDYQEYLKDFPFYRVHNSYLINIYHVKSVFTKDSMIVMTDNKVIPLSRKKKEEFLTMMANLG